MPPLSHQSYGQLRFKESETLPLKSYKVRAQETFSFKDCAFLYTIHRGLGEWRMPLLPFYAEERKAGL